ncbi:hypothetical protein P9112_003739 [Eukaryota sp. TZLM1-RC]
MLKICYTGRITHILRSCAPSIALDFCRSFNSLRTEFFADLLDVEPGMLKSHLFSSANLGGIGFTKSSILCQSAFLGGGKNFIYEFSRRFPDDSHLLVPNCSPYLYELSCELEKLPPQIWTKCFPQSIQEIPNRSLFYLQFCCKKNDSIVPFTNYSSDAFKFLGCWLGNVPQIQNELQVILEKMKIELDSISSLDIEKHIKFFMLKICYTGRITHILRSCAPSIALDFCRSFNSLRTEFFADLLDVEPGMLKSHLFSSANLGGIGFTKSSILCQSAFLGGGKNFIYEFSRRFPDDSHLLVPNCSPYLYELSCELEKLPPQIWTKCFPQSIQEIPNRSLFNLQFCCKKNDSIVPFTNYSSDAFKFLGCWLGNVPQIQNELQNQDFVEEILV